MYTGNKMTMNKWYVNVRSNSDKLCPKTGSEVWFNFDDIYFYRTEQNPHGCCDGYMWDSVVDNCVGMYSAIT